MVPGASYRRSHPTCPTEGRVPGVGVQQRSRYAVAVSLVATPARAMECSLVGGMKFGNGLQARQVFSESARSPQAASRHARP